MLIETIVAATYCSGPRLGNYMGPVWVILWPIIVNKMERPPDNVEKNAESVHPKDQGPSAFGPSEPARGDQTILTVSTEALLKISHDMAQF